jgi:hypothetical protein
VGARAPGGSGGSANSQWEYTPGNCLLPNPGIGKREQGCNTGVRSGIELR